MFTKSLFTKGNEVAMKRTNSIFVGWHIVILVIVALTAGLLEPAYCQTDGTALLLKQTPAEGGTITPGEGLHHFEPNTDITLTAAPKPGYQFVYWIGDVSDPTVSRTIAYMDSPKIIIAVFERSEHDFPTVDEVPAGSFGRGGLTMHAMDYARGGGGGGGGKRWSWPKPPEPPEPPEPDENVPVPQHEPDFPVPEVPEPATILLLGAGTALLLRQKSKYK